MAISLRRTNKIEDLSSRGRQVKREGEILGLPTSESKRTKRNPMASFQNILSNRPTIRIKKSVVQSAADKKGTNPVPQGKTAVLRKKEKTPDKENINPSSRIPLPQKKTLFGNPFTKKKSSVVPTAYQAPKQNLVKVRAPVPKVEEKKSAVCVPRATSATSRPVSDGMRRLAPSSQQMLSRPVTNTSVIVSQQMAPEPHRKALGVISQTSNDSSSSSVTSQTAVGVSSRLVPVGTLNQSLNSSFLQTFSNMNTMDRRGHRVSKENPQSGPYLRFSARPPLQTVRVSDPATSHLLLLPQTTELPCTPVTSDALMVSPRPRSQLSHPLLELDHFRTDFLLCPEYAQGVFCYLKQTERRFMPVASYLSKQKDINEGMRSILVDWLVEVSMEYKFNPQTLFLAVNYIDRFLSCMSVNRTKLQLVGTCCMYMASKFEEIYPPDLSEFAFITEDTYSKRQVVRMEALVLKALEFNLLAPTAYMFAERYMRAVSPCPPEFKHLVGYLCELSLLSDKVIIRFHPSLVAACAVSLSAEVMGQESWSGALTRHTGYSWQDIQTCRTLLHRHFNSAPKLQQQAVQTKYRSAEFLSVSRLTLPLPRH